MSKTTKQRKPDDDFMHIAAAIMVLQDAIRNLSPNVELDEIILRGSDAGPILDRVIRSSCKYINSTVGLIEADRRKQPQILNSERQEIGKISAVKLTCRGRLMRRALPYGRTAQQFVPE